MPKAGGWGLFSCAHVQISYAEGFGSQTICSRMLAGSQETSRTTSPHLLGPAFGRTDFSRIFIFEPPDFFADFLAGFFLLIFVGKSAQKNPPGKSPAKSSKIYTTKVLQHAGNFANHIGRLIFVHLQCWEVLPFCRFQRQRCIKIRVLRAQDFYTPLALKTAKWQHLPALEVYKSQPPTHLHI